MGLRPTHMDENRVNPGELTFDGVHPETLRGEPPSTYQGETGWTSMAISAQRLEKVKLGSGRIHLADTSHFGVVFALLILAMVLASLSNGSSVHRNRRFGSAKSRLFVLAYHRKVSFYLFEALGKNSQNAAIFPDR
jgi:hypothetical protein